MRIQSKVALVGGIPIVIAAGIAVAAGLLLHEADRARRGAVLAGSASRDLIALTTARDDYVGALPMAREQAAGRVRELARSADRRLEDLAQFTRDADQQAATRQAQQTLGRHQEQMERLRALSGLNDQLIGEMNARAGVLVALADEARARQNASNADIAKSLAERDGRLRQARDIVDQAHELHAAVASVQFQRSQGASPVGRPDAPDYARRLGFAVSRLRHAAAELARLLRGENRDVESDRLLTLVLESQMPALGGLRDADLASWIEQLVKVHSTEQRSLHDETAQLLAYSVQASETEQATQNIAIETLRLGQRTGEALARRDIDAIRAILDQSGQLGARMAALPISPLIQTEMVDAIAQWRDRLATTSEGLGKQNLILADMRATGSAMVGSAGALNDLFTGDADRIGQLVLRLLMVGAALGLLVGGGTAFIVARSITRPLKRLQDEMFLLAADPASGPIAHSTRRDELGAMARAANFFVTEIGRRERALREAKERADATLAELQATQASLIQSEKLASLGQLVAGVAHEINTPLGVALSTSTAVEREVRQFGERIASGRLLRSEITRSLDRLGEGCRLLFANLTRAADLVHSFKQVAADRASGERRRFAIKGWVGEVLTSLGPLLRKSGHDVSVEAPDDLVLDSYPGALAQVVTNLVTNALAHAYPDGRAGRLALRIAQSDPGTVRIVFCDDGDGIAPEHLHRVFDPFFTTGRDRGGSGLGLHIVYNLVTGTLGGAIEVDSQPGRGTRFTIDLPTTVADDAVPTFPVQERLSA